MVAQAGGMREGKALLAFLPGGASTGFLPAARADIDLVREPGSLEERLLHEVARLARDLEEPYGTVIRKRFFDRRSLAEIASELDRPLGTVHSQAKRGLERLRERIASRIRIDEPTSRRLFTLICVLHFREWNG